MDPALIGKKRLVAPASRDRGRAPAAVAGLLVAVAGFGLLQAHFPSAGPTGPSSLRAAPAVTNLAGSLVPTPAAVYGFHAPIIRAGAYVLHRGARAAPLTVPQSQTLMASYLSTMSGQGWILQAKQDPSPTGEWTLRWEFQGTVALITMTTAPKDRLEVDLCPPDLYC
jgi:hypothetical protein